MAISALQAFVFVIGVIPSYYKRLQKEFSSI